MFERNRIDNAQQQMTMVPAELTLDDGSVVKGRFIISHNRSIYDVLNGDTHFLDFETYAGERSLIARGSLKAVKLVSVPNGANLKNRVRDTETFEPHTILGIAPEASFDDVRAAYLKLSKIYHPDRFAGVDFPPEVRDYLSAMVRRINAAYAALEAPIQAARRAAIEKAKPVFTSGRSF